MTNTRQLTREELAERIAAKLSDPEYGKELVEKIGHDLSCETRAWSPVPKPVSGQQVCRPICTA